MGTIISASDLTVSQIQTGVVIVDQDTKDYANNTIEWQVLGKDQDGNGTITIQTKTGVGDGAEGYGLLVDERRYDPSRNKLDSELQVWLDTDFYNHIGTNLKNTIIPTTKAITPYQEGDISSRECKLFNLSVAEVGGYDLSGSAPEYYTPESGAFTYQYYQGIESTANSSKRVHTGGNQDYWWLRSPSDEGSNIIWHVMDGGSLSTYQVASKNRCPSPACVLPSSIRLEEVTTGKYNIVWGDSGNKFLDKDGTEHLIDKIKADKEDKFRFSTMPTASADWLGKTVEYTGTTTSNYTHSKRYECQVVPESDPVAYQWVVEAGSTQDERIKSEITEIGVRLSGATATPYIKYSFAMPSINDMTFADIIAFANSYYNDEITLAQLQQGWELGQYASVSLSAMPSYSGTYSLTDSGHSAQTVQMMLVAFNHYDLATPINGKDKALLTFYMKDCLLEKGQNNGQYSDRRNVVIGWKDQARRGWCQNVVTNALPQNVQDNIKVVTRECMKSGSQYESFEDVEDTIFFPENKEITGTTPNYGGGTQYPYFDSAAKRIKKVDGVASDYWMGNTVPYGNGNYAAQGIILADGTKNGYAYDTAQNGLAFAFCI